MQHAYKDAPICSTVEHGVHACSNLVAAVHGPDVREQQHSAGLKHGCQIPLPAAVEHFEVGVAAKLFVLSGIQLDKGSQ